MTIETEGTAQEHILVIDDEAANFKVLDSLVLQAGYRVSLAKSGEEALQQNRINERRVFIKITPCLKKNYDEI